jgi:DNA polymerase III subunit alpha
MYANLHLHTHYSTYDGAMSPADVRDECLRTKQAGAAITDHGVISGVPEFVGVFTDAGLKAVGGCEFYLRLPTDKQNRYHITLLAANMSGWQEICNLYTISNKPDHFYRKPCLFPSDLANLKHVVCLTGCVASLHGRLLQGNRIKEAKNWIKYLEKCFPRRLFLEIQPHNMPEQHQINDFLLSHPYLPTIATADSHHACGANCAMAALMAGRENIIDLPFGTVEQMANMPQKAVDMSYEVLEKCKPLTLKSKQTYFPSSSIDTTTKMFDDARSKFPGERLEYEIEVITKLGFAPYFAVLYEIKQWCDTKGIIWGPGRGSAAGSLLCYALGITNVDPIKYGLLFERFLNPDRVSLPDIDIDVPHSKRQILIDHIVAKYGAVYNIGTIMRSGIKTAIRDACRYYGTPKAETDGYIKAVASTIQGVEPRIEDSLARLEAINAKPEILQIVKALHKKPRSYGTHAAGIVIVPPGAPTPPCDNKGAIPYDMNHIEAMGLVKYDFLGLKTLSILDDLKHLPKPNYDCFSQEVINLLQSGCLHGVFQVERSGIANYTASYKPKNIRDISDILALYRPGPLESGVAKKALFRQQRSILDDGEMLLIYQEQVMQIAREKAGYTLAEADLLRKAIGKKKPEELAIHKERFEPELWAVIEKFGAYGFNLSHSIAYAHLTYATAFYKALFPAEFYAAYLRAYAGDRDKTGQAIMCARYDCNLQIAMPQSIDDWEAKGSKNTLHIGLNNFAYCKTKPNQPGKRIKQALYAANHGTWSEQILVLGAYTRTVTIPKDYGIVLSSSKHTSKNTGNNYYMLVVDTGSSVREMFSGSDEPVTSLVFL